jgi:hypothetical protein
VAALTGAAPTSLIPYVQLHVALSGPRALVPWPATGLWRFAARDALLMKLQRLLQAAPR